MFVSMSMDRTVENIKNALAEKLKMICKVEMELVKHNHKREKKAYALLYGRGAVLIYLYYGIFFSNATEQEHDNVFIRFMNAIDESRGVKVFLDDFRSLIVGAGHEKSNDAPFCYSDFLKSINKGEIKIFDDMLVLDQTSIPFACAPLDGMGWNNVYVAFPVCNAFLVSKNSTANTNKERISEIEDCALIGFKYYNDEVETNTRRFCELILSGVPSDKVFNNASKIIK